MIMVGRLWSTLVAVGAVGVVTIGALAHDRDKSGSSVGAANGVKESVSEAFFVTLDTDGEEETIAKAGPIEVFARCVVGDIDRIKILLTSSVAGWFESTSNTRFKAGDEREVVDVSSGGENPTYESAQDKFSVIGPDEDDRVFYISIDGDTLGLGLNLFGHECFAVGTVTIAELRSNDDRRRWKWRKGWRGDNDD